VQFFDYRGALVFAHRGGSALGPENTLPAFDAGLEAGADGLELDVQLSADGVPVVHHDLTLERTTDATGTVESHTADALARVDAAYRFEANGAFPLRGQGVGVPSLRTVLARYRDARLIIEMKVDTPALASAVVAEVQRAGAVERVCLAGFGSTSLAAARAALPDAASSASAQEVRLALYRSWIGWPVRHVAWGGYQVPEVSGIHRIVSRRFLRHARDAGLRVQVWTVDDPGDMVRLLEWGADGLISNRPDVAVAVRNQCARGATSAS